MIALNDLSRIHQPRLPDITAALARVAASGWYVLGGECQAFEQAFARYCGAAEAIGVANGTDALEIALRALGAGPGSRVALPANAGTYATVAVLAAGATPVFADVDPVDMTLRPDALAALGRLDIVIATHLYGRLARIEDIAAVARDAGAALIEDCAQAHGARRGGRMAGTFGHVGCYSFYPTKNLGALGDGGALVTRDTALAERMRSLRQYGWARKYHCVLPGGRNSRLDEMQAAVLRTLLPDLDHLNARRRDIARRYDEGIRHPAIAPGARGGDDDVAHLYVVRSPARAALARHLESRGVQTDIHYPVPDHRQPMFGERFAGVSLPVTERLAGEILTLPCHPALADADVAHVIEACNAFPG